MTDRKRSASGNAARILATGASIAAGLGMIGAFDAAATAAIEAPPAPDATAVQVIRRVVVVSTTQPDVVLQMSGGSGVRVVQEQPAPIIRTRPRAQTQTATQAPPPAQTTSSGS